MKIFQTLRLFLSGGLMMAACFLMGCASPTPSAVSSDPAAVTKLFYSRLQEHNVDGLPQGKAWRALEPLVTPELATSIREARRAQYLVIKNSPSEKPPWIEGDLFSSLFEGPQEFAFGTAVHKGGMAEVPVRMTYRDRGETVRWTDTVELRRTSRGWLVDDIRYGGKWPFAAKGNLKEVLLPEGC